MRRAYWEIKEEPIVKLSKLYQLLSENPYCGPEKENDESHSGKKVLKFLLKIGVFSVFYVLNLVHSF